MEVKLVAVEGEWRDQVFPITEPAFVIGRAATCQLQIDHSLIDLEHCRILQVGDRVVLEDMGSTFGTSLNGRRAQRVDLHDGDRLRIGPTTFLVSITGAGAAPSVGPGGLVESEGSDRPRGRAPGEDTPVVESARQIYERIISRKAEPVAEAESVPEADENKPHSRLQVVREEEGISLVNILDRAIIHDNDIREIGQELDELIQNGHKRIVLDFGNVKHMSSQAVGVLLQTQKRCKSGGGLLKLCNPLPSVAEVFKITNLPRAIEIHPDEEKALRTGWPEAPPPPVSAPAAKPKPAGDEPPTEEIPIQVLHKFPATARPVPGVAKVTGEVRLVLEVGKSKGKAIKITGPNFQIGRDAECQLRPASTAVSRKHTRITIRDGYVYVRDLGTTNGTLLAHRLLRGTEAEAHNGDLLQIGPMLFRIVWDKPSEPAVAVPTEDSTASWLLQGSGVGGMSDTALFPLGSSEALEEARKRAMAEVRHVRSQVVGGATVVTILTPELRDEDQIAPIRHELITLMDQPVPRNVVLRMDRVTFLASSAIGMLLAHHQRLARGGGGLRFALVRPDVRPALETQRVTMLVEIFDSVEAAVREPWPIADGAD